MTSSRNIHKQQQQEQQGPEEALVVVVDRLDNKLNFKTPRTQNKKKILGPEETRANSTTTTTTSTAATPASPTTSMMDNNNINNKLSESETYSCSTTQSHEEEEEEKMLAGQQQQPQEQQDQQEPQQDQDQQQEQDQDQQRRRQQQQLDEFREAIDHELKQLNLPNIEHQLKNNRKLMLKERNALIPTTIVVNIKDDDNENDDDIDNCSLVSGLTLPQEIVLLRTIADNSKKAKAMKSKNKTSSSSSSSSNSMKARNKVSSKDHGTNRSSSHRRQRRPTTDQGDLQPNRAHDLEIQLILNGQLMKGTYSGALSHGAPPRKPNGVGVIKFDNGDMYMGDVQNGKLHGNGTLVNGDTVLRGEFENNLFVL
eukprot:scaffold1767_cov71-Cylindrotheca_fusiformis.AAC.2